MPFLVYYIYVSRCPDKKELEELAKVHGAFVVECVDDEYARKKRVNSSGG